MRNYAQEFDRIALQARLKTCRSLLSQCLEDAADLNLSDAEDKVREAQTAVGGALKATQQ